MLPISSMRTSVLRPFAQCTRTSYIRTPVASTRSIWTSISRTATRTPSATGIIRSLQVSRKDDVFWNSRRSTASSTAPGTTPPASETELPILPTKSVGIWLMVSSTLVFAIIVIGGVTRLTESGLSITEWKPVTGIIPPLTQEDWEEEFTKYKATPEFKLLNHSFEMDDFKRIFYMEWGHRVLGRLIGVAFVGPLAYFAIKRRISKPLALRLGGLALLIGAQGALGWYMVKSGLEDTLMDTPGAVPRVSQYRLASHLGLAFLLYGGMFSTGMAIIKESKFVHGAVDKWMGMNSVAFNESLRRMSVEAFRARAWILTALVFVTALSGAFVAGLDAGLLYNEFPLMGGKLAPPRDELMSPAYAKRPDGSFQWWRNIFENPVTVQFDHRVLAMTSYLGVSLLFLRARGLGHVLPPATMTSMNAALAMVNIQLLLGISTLIHLVPVPLAAAHQAGSVALLSAMIHVLLTLRRPSAAARAWRTFYTARSSPRPKVQT